MEPWLNDQDFRDKFGLPLSFKVNEKMSHLVKMVVEDWLTDLIGENRVIFHEAYLKARLLNQVPAIPERDKWNLLVKKFLLYAAMKDFVTLGDFELSQTGFVYKKTTQSEPIEKEERVSLSAFYRSKAKLAAIKLKESLAANCSPVDNASVTRPFIRKASVDHTSKI